MSARPSGPCAECDPSSASTASVSSDLHKYHVACSCGGCGGGAQYSECVGNGLTPPSPNTQAQSAALKQDRPPALPPRPPPRTRPNTNTSTRNEAAAGAQASSGSRKYVWWCTGMGAAVCSLGGLLLAAGLLLRTQTASLNHLETVPTPVPATMLVLTGLCVMSLARRRNRYSYLIKIAGACCLVCAVTCVLVTITTTVIHMNRLQTFRECIYMNATRTCICYSVLLDGSATTDDEEEEGVKCVFEAISDCAAIHGALYSCLRAIFGLSVAGVLLCICSAMLAYQLLSHERKKMYWEQLELRCRSLYRPANSGTASRIHNPQPQVCGECCAQCQAAAAVSWDLQQRFWASGRVGNLYSPNPGTGRRVSPWSWFPWPRNTNQRPGGGSSGDSAYGFGNNPTPSGYWQLGPPPPYTPHHRYFHQHMSANMTLQHHAHAHHSHSPSSLQLSAHAAHTCPGQSSIISHCAAVAQGSMEVDHWSRGDPAAVLAMAGRHLMPIADESRERNDESLLHAVECHHQSNSENYPENHTDIHHQHSCTKHNQRSESDLTVVQMQGEENLAFQCEKQSPQRQVRSGESELYFADVSSCCNMSLKTVEYCGGLVGTIEAQPDTSSGDSDAGHCPAFKARPPRPRHSHPLPQTLSTEQLNNVLHGNSGSQKMHLSPSKARHRSPNISLDNHAHCQLTLSQEISTMNCQSAVLRYEEDNIDTMCRDALERFRCQNRCSSSKCLNDDQCGNLDMQEGFTSIHCHSSPCQNSSAFARCMATPTRSSMLVRPGSNRASMIVKQTSSDMGLPMSMEITETTEEVLMKRKPIDESMLECSLEGADVSISPMRRGKFIEDNNATDNDTSLSSIISKEEAKNRRKQDDGKASLSSLVHTQQFGFLEGHIVASEAEGSRRGIVEGSCLGPDLRYEPVRGLEGEPKVNGEEGHPRQPSVHLRCCSDSNTMDSGWQSGSEKHVTD